MLEVFFEEMWPVLCDATETLTHYIESDAHEAGGELPGKTFYAAPGFEALQTGHGALTHSFKIGDATGRRMVVPYQIWMLQRVESQISRACSTAEGRSALEDLLSAFPSGHELLNLETLLAGCRLHRDQSRLFADS